MIFFLYIKEWWGGGRKRACWGFDVANIRTRSLRVTNLKKIYFSTTKTFASPRKLRSFIVSFRKNISECSYGKLMRSWGREAGLRGKGDGGLRIEEQTKGCGRANTNLYSFPANKLSKNVDVRPESIRKSNVVFLIKNSLEEIIILFFISFVCRISHLVY